MIRVALIGTGGISLANHVPGIALCPDARIVALCDVSEEALARASQATGVTRTSCDPIATAREDGIDAVIIATPNHVHRDIAIAAIATGKHVLCEKPIAMNVAQAREMVEAAERAGVRHMTAFTYRFVPAMRYLKHLVSSGALGEPVHFRAQRFQDWGRRYLAWRQRAEFAGTGELGDMLSHRLDYGHYLIGQFAQVSALMRQIVPTRTDAAGVEHPADVEDWVACIGTFRSGATACLESTKVATGRGDGATGHDLCEVNGTEASAAYRLGDPHHILFGKKGGLFERVPVPEEFLKEPGSPRNPHEGDPLMGFRYDQTWRFLQSILDGTPVEPSFRAGLDAQIVMEAIAASAASGRLVDVSYDAAARAGAAVPEAGMRS
ncbi:MAG TPA: Gfo/Idh/MocA family oxidoreductase [Vicinamibacterales bacterium]